MFYSLWHRIFLSSSCIEDTCQGESRFVYQNFQIAPFTCLKVGGNRIFMTNKTKIREVTNSVLIIFFFLDSHLRSPVDICHR